MEPKQLKRFTGLRRLHTYTDEDLLQNFSIYESALIDLSDIHYRDSVGTPNEMEIQVGKDLAALNRFIASKENIMLPCPECKRKQPFIVIGCNNPCVLPEESSDTPGLKAVRSGSLSRYRNVFQGYTPTYIPGSNRLCYIATKKQHIEGAENDLAIQRDECIKACKDGLLTQIPELRREFSCGFNSKHKMFVEFRIFDPISMIDASEAKKIIEEGKNTEFLNAYQQMETCVVIEKTGQYPSIADLQMFDIEKYRRVLDKDSYRDFTRAIGLYADGIGCGSFIYLRRILEKIVVSEHKKCLGCEGWNEKKYDDARFDEKLRLLEKFGKKIVPDSISVSKNKIYGVLSRGVHESTEEECLGLFPAMKFAIEEILEDQLQKKEREKRLEEFHKTMQSQ